MSMFSMDPVEIQDPDIPECEPWSQLEMVMKEKEITGMYLSGHPLDDYRVEIDHFCSSTVSAVNEDINALKGRQLQLAGIVTSAKHGTTKNGKPFGTFVIEDYTDSMRIALFSEDYLKFRHFLRPDEFLFITGKVDLRFRSEDTYEFKPHKIQLLSEVRAKLAKCVTMQLSLADLNEQFVEELKNIITSHAGQCRLNFVIGDRDENSRVELHSSSFKVDPSNQLIDSLKGLKGVHLKLS